ncbi:MAG: peptide chain release factor N(5)-glutamine methyltransferase [Alphaproteobacteria bacterium]|nr:peptide chain release factor N(5)-glutamine methyltransferase [Alphaproteobacteria bacterium]
MPQNRSTDETTIADLFTSASVRLGCAGIADPFLNIRVLVGHALGLAPKDVSAQAMRVLTEEEQQVIEALIARREKRETLNRIIGKGEFCGLWFSMNEATLEPRPESESIVRSIVKRVRPFGGLFPSRKPLRILDLGTGSGCILLSFLHALPKATGLGIDIAPRAIEQARENAKRLGLDGRSAFRLNDWHTGIDEQFDIVSFNPPYIPLSDKPKLMPAVRDFDPPLALFGGEDGLDPYRMVIPALPGLLKDGGYAGIELGDEQTQDVGRLLKEAGFKDIDLLIDFRGFDRVFIVRKDGTLP